jgi:hypothetical protein
MKNPFALALASGIIAQLAPLETEDTRIYLGAWYDRLNGGLPF